jgi:hypothetical protein
MLDLDDRLDELKQLGLYRRTRTVSAPSARGLGPIASAGTRGDASKCRFSMRPLLLPARLRAVQTVVPDGRLG